MPEILFQNDHMIAVEKPAGWLTVPSRFEAEDKRQVLGRWLEEAARCRLYPVHRLDFDVSGVVLFAKTANAQKESNRWFERQLVQKTYQGISGARDFSHWPGNLPRADEEIPLATEMVWTCQILRGKRRSYEHPKGDRAVTEAFLVKINSDDKRWHWQLRPRTGRPHQLRFEMSRHGFPLLGDQLYGSQEKWETEDGIALRAVSLDLQGIEEGRRLGLPSLIFVKGLFE